MLLYGGLALLYGGLTLFYGGLALLYGDLTLLYEAHLMTDGGQTCIEASKKLRNTGLTKGVEMDTSQPIYRLSPRAAQQTNHAANSPAARARVVRRQPSAAPA